jgi:lysozyme family protein
MADFKSAIALVLDNEGGYSNRAADAGGETYCGISRKYHNGWQGWPMIDKHKPLRQNEKIDDWQLNGFVNTFYYGQYWKRIRGDEWQEHEPATYFLDWFVTSEAHAVKALQKIVGVDDDGVFGGGTMAAINAYEGDLLSDLLSARTAFYTAIGTGDNAANLRGWLNRANEMYSKLKNA